MKEKKGFTLVELLAVIAILAILVIMALPAVLRMYRQSRINNFQNEVRSVYRTAQSQFLGDSMLLESGQTIAYTNAGTSVTGVNVVKELDMTGNTDFKYYVLINVDGKVLNVRASNGTYSFSKQAIDANHDLKIEDIDVETNNDSTLDSNITTTVCPTTEEAYGSSSAGEPTVTYKITFNANGGNGTMAAQVFTQGVSQNISGNEFTRTEPGYGFSHWSTEIGGGGEMYTDGQEITLTEDITLYAQWVCYICQD